MRASGEKVRISEAERVQSVSYSYMRSLPGLYTVVCLREGKRSNCLGSPLFRGPLRYLVRKYSSLLVKNLLSPHILFSEPHHNSVFCLQRGPQDTVASDLAQYSCFVKVSLKSFRNLIPIEYLRKFVLIPC